MIDISSYIKMPNGFNSNFKYKEFTKSATAMSLGIPNVPSDDQWLNIEKLVINVLQPVRDKFGGIRITSGFRSPELCAALKRSTSSNHTRGEAADIEPYSDTPLIDILSFIHNNLEYRELIAEYFPDGWIHVAYRENANIKKLKLKDHTHNYAAVDMNYITNIYGNMVA